MIGEECQLDAQCDSGLECRNELCATPLGDHGDQCETDFDCKANRDCINNVCYKLGTIGESCEIDEQCTFGLDCVRETCTVPVMLPGASGDVCLSDFNCRDGFFCNNIFCEAKKTQGGQCQEDSNCLDDLDCIDSVCSFPPPLPGIIGDFCFIPDLPCG